MATCYDIKNIDAIVKCTEEVEGMKYPIGNDVLQNVYCSHTGNEPEPAMKDLLCVVTVVVNRAYEAGVQEGLNAKYNK